jgi:hypothetical protein
MQPVRAVRMLDGRIILRMGEGMGEAMHTPDCRGAGTGGGQSAFQRAAQVFQQSVQRFLVSEGAAALLERGSDSDETPGGSDLSWMQQRVDGGTIFPVTAAAAIPKAPAPMPSATLAVEHYNRIVRLIERGQPVRMEVNIQTRFHPRPIPRATASTPSPRFPGTDLANEVVLLGAHLDSYPYAGGATDNATGSAAMMEAVRVIQASGLKPRRTIRVALWAGEEQGLLGSRAYVRRHFYENGAGTKPAHARICRRTSTSTTAPAASAACGARATSAPSRCSSNGASGQGPRLQGREPAERDLHRPRAVRPGGPAGLPVHPGAARVPVAHAPLEHGHVRPRAADDLTQQGAIAAVFAWYAANSPEKLPRKAMPAKAAGTGFGNGTKPGLKSRRSVRRGADAPTPVRAVRGGSGRSACSDRPRIGGAATRGRDGNATTALRDGIGDGDGGGSGAALGAGPGTATAGPAAASDRLDLDLYWEYETVSDPQLSPDGAQVIYTRQWIDKVNDKRESSLWIMNADGTKQPLPHARQQRALVPLWRPHRLYRAGRAEGHAGVRALHGRRGRRLAGHPRREGAHRRHLGPRRQVDRRSP